MTTHQKRRWTKAAKVILAIFGNAILALVVCFVLAGIGASGVIGAELTHALFWVALAIAVIAATVASGTVSESIKYAFVGGVTTFIVVGGGLLWLDGWLHTKKAEQDALNQPPPSIARPLPIPTGALKKTDWSKYPLIVAPGVRLEQHGGKNNTQVGTVNEAPCSVTQIGGSGNQATGGNCGPPALEIRWKATHIQPPQKPTFLYQNQVAVSVNVLYSPVALAVECDSEVEAVDFGFVGSVVIVGPQNFVYTQNRKIAVVAFNEPSLTPDRSVYINVWSNRAPLNVLNVKIARINPKP